LNTKKIAAIILFTALATVLTPIEIPLLGPGIAPYQIWEIPIMIAAFLFGPQVGVWVAVLRTLTHAAFFQDSTGVFGPIWALVPTLSMLLGIHITHGILARKTPIAVTPTSSKPVIFYTLSAIAFRTTIMPFIDYYVYLFLLPLVIGVPISEAFYLAILPLIVVFNITVPLYTIPVAYFISKKIGKGLKMTSGVKLE
jgi:riboflavin transporter FmnP